VTTFFVDAELLTCMQQLAPSHPSLENGLSKIRKHMQNGITIDSSVVPCVRLNDDDKGFNFSRVFSRSWWHFDESPL